MRRSCTCPGDVLGLCSSRVCSSVEAGLGLSVLESSLEDVLPRGEAEGCQGGARAASSPPQPSPSMAALYLDDAVDCQNHLGPLHRLDRALLQRPLFLLQQTVEDGGDLGHLRQTDRQTEAASHTSPAGLQLHTSDLSEEDVGSGEAGGHGGGLPLQGRAHRPVHQLRVSAVLVLQHHGRLQLLGVLTQQQARGHGGRAHLGLPQPLQQTHLGTRSRFSRGFEQSREPQAQLGSYLLEEVHEAAVGLHLVLQLVEDDEGGEREASALWWNTNIRMRRT